MKNSSVSLVFKVGVFSFLKIQFFSNFFLGGVIFFINSNFFLQTFQAEKRLMTNMPADITAYVATIVPMHENNSCTLSAPTALVVSAVCCEKRIFHSLCIINTTVCPQTGRKECLMTHIDKMQACVCLPL